MRVHTMVLWALVLLVGLFPIILAAPSEASPIRQPAGELTVLIGSDIEDTLPYVTSGRYIFTYIKNVYGYLYRRDGQMGNIPDLATNYEVSEDGLVWTFALRENATFHNGDAFTAKDVAFTWSFVMDPDLASHEAGWFSMVDHVEVIDDFHVAFHLKSMDGTFFSKLAAFFPILPATYFESVGLEGFRENPVGTGPFRFSKREIGNLVEVVAYEEYWGTPPSIEKVIFKVVPEVTTRVAMMQTGEADILLELPSHLVPAIEAAEGLRVVAVPGGDQARIWIDVEGAKSGKFPEFAPLADVRVRRAMNYAVDRYTMADTLLGGRAFIAPSVLPSSVIPPAADLEPYPYDPDMARQLLAEAGYPDGFNLELLTSMGRYPLDREISEVVAAYLSEVGINVTLTTLEGDAWSTRLRGHGEQPFISYHPWSHNIGHPDGMLRQTFMCDGPFPFYCDPEIDAAIDEGVTIIDHDAMVTHYQTLDRRLYDEAVWIFLWENPRVHAVADGVNWTPVQAEPWEKFWDVTLDG